MGIIKIDDETGKDTIEIIIKKSDLIREKDGLTLEIIGSQERIIEIEELLKIWDIQK